MKYYAVIDTNVLVSAMLKWQSVPGSIKHFPKKPFVVTPREMLNIILEDIENEKIDNVAEQVLEKHLDAFKELAK